MNHGIKNTPPALPRHSVPIPTEKMRAGAKGGSQKGRFYKPLPKEFRRDGFEYRQIVREGDGALYEQRWTRCAEPSVCYEVIHVRRREGFEIHGRFVEPFEAYPSSEAWGLDGFTVTDRDKAWAKFFEISLEEPARRGKEVR